MNVLAGDVGGTNARLAHVEVVHNRATIRAQRTYPTRAYPGLAPIVLKFCGEIGARPEHACIGVPCPATEDECLAPNLPWKVDPAAFAAEIGIASSTLINDFTAIGHGIEFLRDDDLETLQAGEPKEHAPIALIGAGTGLGVGFLTWNNDRYDVHGSEGGHLGFAARGERQAGLALALERQYGRVSRERVLSGPGIEATYRYLASTDGASENLAIRDEMERDDPAAVIFRHALGGTDALCEQTLDLFVDGLGAAAGDIALEVLALGGVYVGGGIAPRIVSYLRQGAFLRAFRDKGRLSAYIARVPLHVIINPHVALLGAAAVASRLA